MSFALPYTLKRLIAQFLMPLPLVIELFVFGWALARFTRFKRTGKACVILSACLFLAFSYGLGHTYLYRLERLYPPFAPTPAECERMRGVDILVLGQGMVSESDLPVRNRANGTFYLRLLEGARVCRLLPESRLLVSMAGEAPRADKEQFLQGFAATVGLPQNRFVILDGARDTSEEVCMALAASRTNVLVVATSATHIPRALAIMKRAGATAVPAPCDYSSPSAGQSELSLSNLPLPSGHGFELSKRAAHEWLGSIYEAQKR